MLRRKLTVMSEWLPRALEESRARGFLGPGPVGPHIEHAQGFAQCWEERHETPPESFLDLGSGGGLPALVLLARWNRNGLMTDSVLKRVRFLEEVLEWSNAPTGGAVVHGRIEEIARNPLFVEQFDLVTARSFGPPSVTAECGAQFLKIGGTLIVSEPPDDSETGRWDEAVLRSMGLTVVGRIRHGAAFQVLVKQSRTPSRLPRPVGVPRKRPLF